MRQVMASRTFKCPNNIQNNLRWLQKPIFWYYIKHRLVYLLVHGISLGSIRLCIICIETIVGIRKQKVTLHCIRLLALLSVVLKIECSCFWYFVMQKQSSCQIVIALVRVGIANYINGCAGSFGVRYNWAWIIQGL